MYKSFVVICGMITMTALSAVLFLTSDCAAQHFSFSNPCFDEHHLQFDYDTVVICLEKQLKDDPENIDTILHLARLYRVTKSKEKHDAAFDKALEMFKKKSEIAPLTVKEKLDYAGLLKYKKMYSESEAVLKEATAAIEKRLYEENKSFDVDTMVAVSGLYRSRKQYEKALMIIDRAIKAMEQGDNSDKQRIVAGLIGMKASIYFNNLKGPDSKDKGYHLLNQAMEINPDDLVIKNLLAFYARERKEYDRAIQLYKTLIAQIKYDNYFNKPYRQLGETYEQAGKQDEAEQYYILDITHYPNQVQTYKKLADLYKTRGQKDKAITVYQKGMQAAIANDNKSLADFFKQMINAEEQNSGTGK